MVTASSTGIGFCGTFVAADPSEAKNSRRGYTLKIVVRMCFLLQTAKRNVFQLNVNLVESPRMRRADYLALTADGTDDL
jgi:hypothetical protein